MSTRRTAFAGMRIDVIRVGTGSVRIDPFLLRLAGQRCFLAEFVDEAGSLASLEVVRRSLPAASAVLLDGQNPAHGRVSFDKGVLLADVPDDAVAAELLLRQIFHLEICRQGGLLLHASGLAVGDEALIATGPSTAGKTTFVELGLRIHGSRLLSDEIMAVFPNGLCWGTPFRSTLRIPGDVSPAKVRGLFTLVKGETERIRSAPVHEGMSIVLSQVFRTALTPLPPAEILRRISEFVGRVGLMELTFRKDPAVAGFLSDWLKNKS